MNTIARRLPFSIRFVSNSGTRIPRTSPIDILAIKTAKYAPWVGPAEEN